MSVAASRLVDFSASCSWGSRPRLIVCRAFGADIPSEVARSQSAYSAAAVWANAGRRPRTCSRSSLTSCFLRTSGCCLRTSGCCPRSPASWSRMTASCPPTAIAEPRSGSGFSGPSSRSASSARECPQSFGLESFSAIRSTSSNGARSRGSGPPSVRSWIAGLPASGSRLMRSNRWIRSWSAGPTAGGIPCSMRSNR